MPARFSVVQRRCLVFASSSALVSALSPPSPALCAMRSPASGPCGRGILDEKVAAGYFGAEGLIGSALCARPFYCLSSPTMSLTPISSVSSLPHARVSPGSSKQENVARVDARYPYPGDTPSRLSGGSPDESPSVRRKRGDDYGPKNIQACDRCRRRVSLCARGLFVLLPLYPRRFAVVVGGRTLLRKTRSSS